jgi:beta-mannanase
MNRRRFLKYAGATTAVVGVSALGLGYYHPRQTPSIAAPTTTTHLTSSASVAGSSFIHSTSETLHRLKVPEGGCYLGAYIGDFPSIEQIGEFERMTEKGLAIINLYYPWEDQGPFPRSKLETYAKRGKISMISWKPVLWDPVNEKDIPAIGLQDIIDRKHDDYIRTWAEHAEAFGYPIFLRLAWEMNGDWDRHCGPNNFGAKGDNKWNQVDNLYTHYGDPKKPDGPERYIDAWRHVHDVFESVGAHNVIWVWSPNYENWPDKEWNRSENYYPGDEYVDWAGISLYNHGYVDGKTSWRWRSFDALFSGTEAIKVYHEYKDKPFMLAEYGSAERDNSSASGEKSGWIRQAFGDMKSKYTAIKAAVWFSFDKRSSGGNEKDWRVNSSKESLQAYRESISDAYFLDHVIFEP